jgi:ABC-type nitrate/sulfonate/bicarbonate transport system substrate-binding protein
MLTSRRAFLRTLTACGGTLGVLAVLPACAPAPSAAPTAAPAAATRASRTFKGAYLTLGWAGMEAIDALGLLKERGWNVEWQRVGPISGLVNAFSSGQAEIIDMSIVIAAQMYEQGVKMSIFGAAVGTLGAVVVGKMSGIKSVAELRGKKVAGIPGATATQDVNASIRKAHGLDLFKDTEFVQATAPPDLANLLTKGDVDAVLIWEPTTTQLTQTGTGTILATQQQLWEQASGSKEAEVHVVYLTTPQIAREHPDLLADINAAQRQVADLWQSKDPKLVKAFGEVTQLPESVVREALGRTTPLFGLRDETIGTILDQLAFNRQNGTILQSDAWSGDTAQLRHELFVQVG